MHPLQKQDSSFPYQHGTYFNGRHVGKDKDGKGGFIGGSSGINLVPEALDSLWGYGIYLDWKRQCDGKMEDQIQQTYNRSEELESDPNDQYGLAKTLLSVKAATADDFLAREVDPNLHRYVRAFINDHTGEIDTETIRLLKQELDKIGFFDEST